jgi:hypothetical protein
MHLVRAGLTLMAASAVVACTRDDASVVRGRGLSPAALPAVDQAHVYEAAARSAFDVDNTSLLLDRRLLPRAIGLADAGPISNDVIAELRRRNVVKGTCEPPLAGTHGTARCAAELPGYVVRYSPVLAITGDSVQVYVYSQKYDTPASGRSDVLRFERAYQVVRRPNGAWLAIREGHVPKEARGER